MDSQNEYVQKFEEFFRCFYQKELLHAANTGEKFLITDFLLLDKFDPELSDALLREPATILKSAESALSAIDTPEGAAKIKIRVKNLPEQQNVRIRNLRSEHIGKFIFIEGTVRRASEVKPEVALAIFQCPDCESKIPVLQTERIVKPPVACECGRKGKFALIDKQLFDARWIVVEELYEVASGEKLGEVAVYLKEDLTDPEMQRKCDPGNRLKINGIVRELKKIFKGRLRTQMDMFIEANYIEPTEIEWEEVTITEEEKKKIKELADDPDVYKKLVASIAPSIYGMNEIKEAIILQLFGGVPHSLPDKTKIRGDIHVLLLGDPSTAKSQLLKLISQIIPRGKYVTGRGTTSAGLTATVLKDEEFIGGWVLEAGAMVLANKGVLAVDEFDKMNKEDQIAMHEGLEQQTISIAKASIIATLPAQVSVLAGSNPKFSRFDPYKPIAEQIDIPDTLLSRFDLKFALRDVPDREKDELLATHILETRLNPQQAQPEIPPEFLRKYIAYVRQHCKPQMTREAAEKLKEFYLDMRSLYAEDTKTVAITLRQNEALMRLAEASAKIRLSERVEQQDAARAINIMKYSLQQLGYDYETGKIDIDRTEGVPSSQRSKIMLLIDIIERLEKEVGRPLSKDDVIAEAEAAGIPSKEAEELLQRLKREGMVFEPKQGFVQKI